MPRDSAGNYTLPNPPVVPDTTIESNIENTTNSDLGVALTDSLSRSGKGGMTAAFKIFDGTVTAPGMAFTSEANSGLYRQGAGDVRMSVLATDCMRWTGGIAQVFVGGVWKNVVEEAPEDTAYYSRIDGVWTVDPAIAQNTVDIQANAVDIAANAAEITTNIADIVQNKTDIATNVTDIATNVTDIGTNAADIVDLNNEIITAQAWLGNNLTSTRVDPDFVTEIRMLTQFVSNGLIRHKLEDEGLGSNNIDVGAANRHHVVNDGALTLTLTNLPAVDADIGDTYQQEGQIIIDNTTAGVITLSPVGVVIGEQSAADSVSQILTYAIQRIGGVNKIYYIWSAA